MSNSVIKKSDNLFKLFVKTESKKTTTKIMKTIIYLVGEVDCAQSTFEKKKHVYTQTQTQTDTDIYTDLTFITLLTQTYSAYKYQQTARLFINFFQKYKKIETHHRQGANMSADIVHVEEITNADNYPTESDALEKKKMMMMMMMKKLNQ
ncbi:hypothetical protein Tsp_13355 [Trichinella spiralis]|uniref:hypothetical protein n=1 Tax=Trichinella spiralis TaxID=6334 RepID=UPI0001EFE7E5|nr:hypothetical protein Tsp_13355 [Trichinella spiralis]